MITTAQITNSITKIVIIVIGVLVAFWILSKLQKRSIAPTNFQGPQIDPYGMPVAISTGNQNDQYSEIFGRN